MPQDYSNFANHLNTLLQEHDRSQGWLAKQLKCNPAQVSRWLNGLQRPANKEVILAIGRVFRLQPAALDQLLIAANYSPQNYPAYLEKAPQDLSIMQSKLTVIFDETGVKVTVEGKDFIKLANEDKNAIVNIVDTSLEHIINYTKHGFSPDQYIQSIQYEFTDKEALAAIRHLPGAYINFRPVRSATWE